MVACATASDGTATTNISAASTTIVTTTTTTGGRWYHHHLAHDVDVRLTNGPTDDRLKFPNSTLAAAVCCGSTPRLKLHVKSNIVKYQK
jgi:hypothetical protein